MSSFKNSTLIPTATVAFSVTLRKSTCSAEHVDFLRVTENATVAVGINVEFLNEDKCTGLKLGGVLNVVRPQVELNCPAISIPEKITVDLEGLNVGHTIHILSLIHI